MYPTDKDIATLTLIVTVKLSTNLTLNQLPNGKMVISLNNSVPKELLDTKILTTTANVPANSEPVTTECA